MNYQQLICSICLAAQSNPQKLQSCVHSFCADCISQWLDIKNSCPLCLNFIGTTQYNKLLIKSPQQVQFDVGALNFQNQIKQIDETMKNLQKRIDKKIMQSKNFKTHFPKGSLIYVKDQILLAKNYYSNLEESILMNDSVNSSMYMQLITEVLLDIENVLNGGQIGKMHEDEYDSDEQCQECYSDEENSDDDLEDYLHCKNARKQRTRQKKAAVQSNGQAKSGKIVKL